MDACRLLKAVRGGAERGRVEPRAPPAPRAAPAPPRVTVELRADGYRAYTGALLDGGAAAVEERVKAINVHTAHGANAAWEAVEYVSTAKEALEVAAEAAATAGHDDAMLHALEESATLHLSRWGMASA